LKNSNVNSAEKANYSLVSTRSFLRDLRRLEKPRIRRILETVEMLKSSPYLGKNLRGQLERLRSLRVGDFRVIYSVDESSRTIALRAVGDRKAIYRY
jgi:mRNA interferase RelE/StbE